MAAIAWLTCPHHWHRRKVAGWRIASDRYLTRPHSSSRRTTAPAIDDPFNSKSLAAPPPMPKNPTLIQAMGHRLKTPAGKALSGLRKQLPEPVFGLTASVLGFRHFPLRKLDKVKGGWSLVTMAWNVRRMFNLKSA